MGRKLGSKNRINEEARRVAAATGITPLEYMLRVMRDVRTSPTRRDAMAVHAAPYLHPRLAAIQHSGDPDNPIRTVERIERVIIRAVEDHSKELTVDYHISSEEQPVAVPASD